MVTTLDGNPPRDTMCKRVYEAEDALSECWHQPMEWPAVEEFVAKVNRSRWVRARWSQQVVPVAERRTRVSATAWSDGRIVLPPFAWNRLIVLHEVAHVFTWHSQYAARGPEFCGIYLVLVDHFIGRECRAELRANLRERRVTVSTALVPAPRPVTASPSRVAARTSP